MTDNSKIAHRSEYKSQGCTYIVTSYYSETATENLEDVLVKLITHRIRMDMTANKKAIN
jgi:hypothetical protein